MQNTDINQFTVRVYAIIVNDNNEVLLSDEFQLDRKMTKFPGGGMEFGEGTIECLEREAVEEFGQELEVLGHFYTTDFFQKAMFRSGYQVISIYYKARFKDEIKFRVASKTFDFEELKNGNQSFRWQEIGSLNMDEILFPIDKKVAMMLLEQYKKV